MQQGEAELDNFSIKAASNFLNPHPVISEQAVMKGSALEHGTSLDEYMKEDFLSSPMDATSDNLMQYLPSAPKSKSVLYEDDFESESDDFDLLKLEDHNNSESIDAKKSSEASVNNHNDDDNDLFGNKADKYTSEKSGRALKSKPMMTNNTTNEVADTTISKVKEYSPRNGNSLPRHQTVRSAPFTSHHAKSRENFTEHFEKEKMRQHRRRVATAVSTMHTDNRLSRATMELQLQNALKKLEAYSKLNESLLRKLDASTVDEEFGKYKTVLNEQDEIIARLIEEKKSLERIARNQAKHLVALDTVMGPHGVVVSPEAKIKVLNQKIRNLNEILSTMRKTTNDQNNEIDRLRKQNYRSIKRVNKQKLKIRNNKKNIDMKREIHYEDNSTKNSNSGASNSFHSVESFINTKKEDFGSKPSMKLNSDKLLQKNMENERKLALLEKKLDHQKKEYERYKMRSNVEISEHKDRIKILEEEIEAKDRLSRVQVVEVKRLQQTCKDLSFGNKKLQLASDFYSNVDTDLNMKSQEPSNSSLNIGDEGIKFIQPQPPIDKSLKHFSRSVRTN